MKKQFFAFTLATAVTIGALAVPTERPHAATVCDTEAARSVSCVGQLFPIVCDGEDLTKITELLDTCKTQVYYIQTICPDGSGEAASCPEISDSEASAPDAFCPEVSDSVASTPDTSCPEVSDSEASAPDTSSPEVSSPEASAPEDSDSGVSAPDTSAPEDSDSETSDSDSAENVHPYVLRVLTLVNEERQKAGLNALTLDLTASAAAQVRAKEIVTTFSHTRPDGSSFATALKEQGIYYRQAGENIAYGQKTPEQVMEGWMNSSGHRANILRPSFTHIGVGYEQVNGVNYWTQLFYQCQTTKKEAGMISRFLFI